MKFNLFQIIRLSILMILIFLISCPGFSTDLNGMIVCVDPGHQLHGDSSPEPIGPGSETTKACVSSGTSGKLSGPEHHVNLQIGLFLEDILTSRGINVVMTRKIPEVHICNSERALIANKSGADLFVRLHCNSGTSHSCFTLHPTKIEGWTDDIFEESLKAAQIFQTEYARYTGIPDKGLMPRGDISGFNWSDVTVILPEMFHMQNADDDLKASDPEYLKFLAEGVASGIIKYLETLPPKKDIKSGIVIR
jgi:N-acetylmuramoyl-L-alanine amidase